MKSAQTDGLGSMVSKIRDAGEKPVTEPGFRAWANLLQLSHRPEWQVAGPNEFFNANVSLSCTIGAVTRLDQSKRSESTANGCERMLVFLNGPQRIGEYSRPR